MNAAPLHATILLAEDDADDRMLIQEGFEESSIPNPVRWVENGRDLLRFLKKEGEFSKIADDMPCLVLLDLNMPIMDGREALKIMKQDPELKHIPVIILSTSSAEEDIEKTYNLGVNSYITKPSTFKRLVSTIDELSKYWLETVELPRPGVKNKVDKE